MENNKKLFLIQAPEYDWDYFMLLCDQIEDHFQRILKHLKIYTPEHHSVEIKLKAEISNPEIIRAYAERVSTDPYIYN